MFLSNWVDLLRETETDLLLQVLCDLLMVDEVDWSHDCKMGFVVKSFLLVLQARCLCLHV